MFFILTQKLYDIYVEFNRENVAKKNCKNLKFSKINILRDFQIYFLKRLFFGVDSQNVSNIS